MNHDCTVVTGANRGIGLELCRQLAGRGETVVGVCRQVSAGLAELGIECIEAIDVDRPESIDRLALELSGHTIACLVNNAGILERDRLDSLDFEAIERQFRINAMGPLRVTAALMGLFRRGTRVGIVTSRMGSIGDNTSGGYYGYRMSKAAVNIAGVSLARDLQARGVAIALLHPGMVATEMTGGQGIPPAEAAAGLIRRLDALSPENTGQFWHANGEPLPW